MSSAKWRPFCLGLNVLTMDGIGTTKFFAKHNDGYFVETLVWTLFGRYWDEAQWFKACVVARPWVAGRGTPDCLTMTMPKVWNILVISWNKCAFSRDKIIFQYMRGRGRGRRGGGGGEGEGDIYIYIYRERERDRETETERDRERDIWPGWGERRKRVREWEWEIESDDLAYRCTNSSSRDIIKTETVTDVIYEACIWCTKYRTKSTQNWQ